MTNDEIPKYRRGEEEWGMTEYPGTQASREGRKAGSREEKRESGRKIGGREIEVGFPPIFSALHISASTPCHDFALPLCSGLGSVVLAGSVVCAETA